MKLIHSHHDLARRRINECTGASSTVWAELQSIGISGTLQWQPSATSLHSTLHSKGWMKCPTQWASTHGNPAKFATIFWPIQTTFAIMITYVSFTTILLNALSSICNSLHSGNICHMVLQRNSTMLRNISTQRWNKGTWGGTNGMLIEFCHDYNDFDRIDSYGGSVVLLLSLCSAVQTRHIV